MKWPKSVWCFELRNWTEVCRRCPPRLGWWDRRPGPDHIFAAWLPRIPGRRVHKVGFPRRGSRICLLSSAYIRQRSLIKLRIRNIIFFLLLAIPIPLVFFKKLGTTISIQLNKQVNLGFSNNQPQPKYSGALSKVDWKDFLFRKLLKILVFNICNNL